MSADRVVEQGAEKLERLVEQGRRAGGTKAKLAELFAEDPAFLRKLKPSLIAARAKGEAPTDEEPTSVDSAEPEAPRPRPQARTPSSGGGGPSPFVVVGACLALGLALAQVLDWLGHRYPRA